MKVEITFPRDTDTKQFNADAAKRKVEVEPYFYSGAPRQAAAYITVHTAKGEKRYVLDVSGNSGDLKLVSRTPIAPACDKPKPKPPAPGSPS